MDDGKISGLILFSGGVDSTLAALIIAVGRNELSGLSIRYPGRPAGEIAAARRLASLLAFRELIEVSYQSADSFSNPQRISDASPARGWIPYRNLLFWSMGAHKAAMIGAKFVAAGHDRDDQAVFSDVSEDFFGPLASLLRISGNPTTAADSGVSVVLPLMGASGEVIYEVARTHRDILEETWSCWVDQGTPCGRCFACSDREAFFRALI